MKALMQIKVYVMLMSILLIGCTSLSHLDQKSVNIHARIPIDISENFIWGINGHPVVDKEYVESSLQQQLNLLKEHQFSMYRFDVNLTETGLLRTHRMDRLDSLIQMADSMNIQIFPVLKFYNEFIAEEKLSESQAYSKAKAKGENFARKYSASIQYYGIENELDLKTILPNAKGFYPTDYDSEKMKKTIAYLKGMIDGIKSVDPSAKTVINYGGWYNWGFIQLLIDRGLEFDILGCHWYSEKGRPMFQVDQPKLNVLDVLKKFNKPIWITEINKYNGSKYYTEKQQAEMMQLFLNNLNRRREIEAFFVYELYDQPHLATMAWVNYQAAYYGIVGWTSDPPDYTDFYYKPVSEILKFRIEEASYAYEDFIYSTMQSLYEEAPSEEDLSFWVSRLRILNNKEILLNEIMQSRNSEMYRKTMRNDDSKDFSTFIANTYQAFLNRKPKEREMKFWNRQLKKRMSEKELLNHILLSEEYWENAIWAGYERRTGFKRPQNLVH